MNRLTQMIVAANDAIGYTPRKVRSSKEAGHKRPGMEAYWDLQDTLPHLHDRIKKHVEDGLRRNNVSDKEAFVSVRMMNDEPDCTVTRIVIFFPRLRS